MAAKSGIMTGLTSKQDRLAKLQTLVDELNAEERSALSFMLSRKNGPLALLPLEIVIEIFTYLPIFDPWRLQQVCSQWRDILSSDQLLETSLARRETHNPSDSARSPEMASKDTVGARARRMQTMRRGEPTSSTLFAFRHQERRRFPLPQVHRDFALKADHIAYIDLCPVGTERVVVRNLVKGTMKAHVGVAREAICGIALTTTVVAFLGYHGKLYVDGLKGDVQSLEVRLPSASITAFAADENIVAVVLQTGRPREFMIAICDYTKGSLQEFTASWAHDHRTSFAPPHTLLVDARNGFIDAFGSNEYLRVVLHARFSLDGTLASATDWKLWNGSFPDCDIQPTGEKDIYVFRTDAMKQWDLGGKKKKVVCRTELFFNAQTAKLEERTHAIGVTEHYKASERLDSTLWKDVAITCGYGCQEMKMMFSIEQEASLPSDEEVWKASGEPEETTSGHKAPRPLTRFRREGELNMSQEYSMRHDPDRDWPEHDQVDALYVNDSFVVAVGHTPRRGEDKRRRIHVFCFDEELRCKGFQKGALSQSIPVNDMMRLIDRLVYLDR